MKTLRVEDLMVRDVKSVRWNDDVHELERRMLKEKIHGMPVVDEKERLIGVVSQTDVLAWHYTAGVDGASFYDVSSLQFRREDAARLNLNDIRAATVEEVMSPVVHCIRSEEPLPLAAARMIARRIHRLVVVDEEARVLGIISASDLLRAVPEIEKHLDAERQLHAKASPRTRLGEGSLPS